MPSIPAKEKNGRASLLKLKEITRSRKQNSNYFFRTLNVTNIKQTNSSSNSYSFPLESLSLVFCTILTTIPSFRFECIDLIIFFFGII